MYVYPWLWDDVSSWPHHPWLWDDVSSWPHHPWLWDDVSSWPHHPWLRDEVSSWPHHPWLLIRMSICYRLAVGWCLKLTTSSWLLIRMSICYRLAEGWGLKLTNFSDVGATQCRSAQRHLQVSTSSDLTKLIYAQICGSHTANTDATSPGKLRNYHQRRLQYNKREKGNSRNLHGGRRHYIYEIPEIYIAWGGGTWRRWGERGTEFWEMQQPYIWNNTVYSHSIRHSDISEKMRRNSRNLHWVKRFLQIFH